MSLLPARLRTEAGVLATRVFTVMAGIATGAMTARSLGPAERGEYFYIIAVATVLSQFCHLGAPGSNTYFVSRKSDTARRLIVYSFALATITTTVSIGFVITIAKYHILPDLVPSTRITLLAPLTFGVLSTLLFSAILAGQQRFTTLNVISIISNAALLAWYGSISIGSATVEAFLIASTVVAVLGALLLAAVAFWGTNADTPEISIGKWLGYSRRAYLVLLLGSLVPKIGVLAVKYWSSDTELGYYSIAVQSFDAMSILPSSIALILFPSIIRSSVISWDICKTEIIRMTKLSSALAFCAALAMPFAVRILFGSDFTPATYPAILFLPGFVLLATITVASQFLAALAFPRAVALNWACCIFTLGAACALLVPAFGAIGAAAATSLAYGMLAILMIRTARHLLPRNSTAS